MSKSPFSFIKEIRSLAWEKSFFGSISGFLSPLRARIFSILLSIIDAGQMNHRRYPILVLDF